MNKFIGSLAIVGLVGAIGFAEMQLALAVSFAALMLPYIVKKAHQPLEEEEL